MEWARNVRASLCKNLSSTFRFVKKAVYGELTHHKRGVAILNDNTINKILMTPRTYQILKDIYINITFEAEGKDEAFTLEERKSLGLEGLLPPMVLTLEQQVKRVIINLERIPDDLDKYVYLRDLQDTNECLFYHCLIEHVALILPLVYTPVVGLACQNYGLVYRRPRGLFISIQDKGNVEEVLRNWPWKDVRAIVVTDGERILGLGDLGANGMGIPIGKMVIYSAFGGINPQHCLPITLDVGTNNTILQMGDHCKYVGTLQPRVTGEEYEQFIDEFMAAVVKVFGRNTFIQFEDFASTNAFKFLARYRDNYTMMNDDIQGSAAVTVAGILAAGKFTGKDISSNTILFVGAGQSGLGIAKLLVMAMGGDPQEARRRIYFKRSTKLVIAGDENNYDPTDERRLFCHEVPEGSDIYDLVNIIKWMKPNIMIGVSGTGKVFTTDVLRAMAEVTDTPIIMPLSNPTHMAECTAEEAYLHTDGRCLFASGSPFPPLEAVDRPNNTWAPKQCNNAYIFPGVALGTIVAGMTTIPEDVFLIAAKTLALDCVEQADFDAGSLFPPLERARECSIQIATAVMQYAFDKDLSTIKSKPNDIKEFIRGNLYNPHYQDHNHHHCQSH